MWLKWLPKPNPSWCLWDIYLISVQFTEENKNNTAKWQRVSGKTSALPLPSTHTSTSHPWNSSSSHTSNYYYGTLYDVHVHFCIFQNSPKENEEHAVAAQAKYLINYFLLLLQLQFRWYQNHEQQLFHSLFSLKKLKTPLYSTELLYY